MAFEIVVPSHDDAPAVASIHLAAMDANLLMHAQFPNPEALRFLREWLCRDTQDHIKKDNMGILVARNSTDGSIASFIKWNLQRPSDNKEHQVPEDDIPDCCRREYLDSYAELCKKARDQVLGDQPHLHVTYLCTHPEWSGRGAASELLRNVQDRAAAESVPVVLEATMNAVTFYQKLGLDIRQELEMTLPPRGSSEPTERYSERTMIWTRPGRL